MLLTPGCSPPARRASMADCHSAGQLYRPCVQNEQTGPQFLTLANFRSPSQADNHGRPRHHPNCLLGRGEGRVRHGRPLYPVRHRFVVDCHSAQRRNMSFVRQSTSRAKALCRQFPQVGGLARGISVLFKLLNSDQTTSDHASPLFTGFAVLRSQFKDLWSSPIGRASCNRRTADFTPPERMAGHALTSAFHPLRTLG